MRSHFVKGKFLISHWQLVYLTRQRPFRHSFWIPSHQWVAGLKGIFRFRWRNVFGKKLFRFESPVNNLHFRPNEINLLRCHALIFWFLIHFWNDSLNSFMTGLTCWIGWLTYPPRLGSHQKHICDLIRVPPVTLPVIFLRLEWWVLFIFGSLLLTYLARLGQSSVLPCQLLHWWCCLLRNTDLSSRGHSKYYPRPIKTRLGILLTKSSWFEH